MAKTGVRDIGLKSFSIDTGGFTFGIAMILADFQIGGTYAWAIEALKIGENYKVFTDSGRTETNIDIFEWIKEVQDIGVGEIILTSINKEGTGKGFDIELSLYLSL